MDISFFDKALSLIITFFTSADPRLTAQYKAEAQAALAAQAQAELELAKEKEDDAIEDANYEQSISELQTENTALKEQIASYEAKIQAVLDQFGLSTETPEAPTEV